MMNIKGLSIEDIMNMDWDRLNRLSDTEMRQLTSRLVSASNKRIRRLEKTSRGTSSLAYQTVELRGRDFSVRGKNINQVRNEFKITKHFLQMKTSTVKGWKKYRSQIEERTGYATEGESLNWGEPTWKKYWKVYRRFDEIHHGEYKKGDSDRIQKMLTEIMDKNDKRRSADTFQKLIEDEYKNMYESDEDNEDNEDIQDSFDVD